MHISAAPSNISANTQCPDLLLNFQCNSWGGRVFLKTFDEHKLSTFYSSKNYKSTQLVPSRGSFVRTNSTKSGRRRARTGYDGLVLKLPAWYSTYDGLVLKLPAWYTRHAIRHATSTAKVGAVFADQSHPSNRVGGYLSRTARHRTHRLSVRPRMPTTNTVHPRTHPPTHRTHRMP